MFERFTESARQVVVLAQEEARGLGHNYIGTEHLLLGLLRVDDEAAAGVLESLGLSLEPTRAAIAGIVSPSDSVTSGQIPFTPRAKKVLELALRESLSLGHNYIGTEHVLLGLVREDEGVASTILREFDAGPEEIRNAVLAVVPSSSEVHQHGAATTAAVGLSNIQFTAGPDQDLRRLLKAAAGRALTDGRDEFGLADILAAADDEGGSPDAA